LAVRLGAGGFHPGAACGIKKIAGGKSTADIPVIEEFAAGVDDEDIFGDELRGERDIGGDRDIARLGVSGDESVGDIGAFADGDGAYESVGGGEWDGSIGDEGHFDHESAGGAKDEILDIAGRGIGIDPDFHDVRARETSGLAGGETKKPAEAGDRPQRVFGFESIW
jgi:hypothetical protein